MTDTLTTRIATVRDTLQSGLVERDIAIRLAMLAALSGEHLLLIGPPGTAKSLVARRLRRAFDGGNYFEHEIGDSWLEYYFHQPLLSQGERRFVARTFTAPYALQHDAAARSRDWADRLPLLGILRLLPGGAGGAAAGPP